MRGLHMPRWLGWAAAGILPVLLYLPTWRYGFVYDDLALIVHNAALHDLRHFGDYFTRDIDALWRSAAGVTSNYYRPLSLSVMALIWHVVGAQPAAWHAAVVLLHGVAGLLAMAVLRLHGATVASALAGAVLFAWHPVHVHSVAWVSGIQDVLLGVTALTAYCLYRVWRLRSTAGWLVLALCAYASALLCKESAVGLWLVVTGEWLWSRRRAAPTSERFSAWPVVLFGMLVLGYLVLRVAVLGAVARPALPLQASPLLLVSVPLVACSYLKLLVWPVGLSFFSPVRAVASFTAPAALAGFGAVAVLLVAASVGLRRRPSGVLPTVWCVAWLAPCLNLWVFNPEWIVVDRYLYLPALAVGWVLVDAGAGVVVPRWRWMLIGIVGTLFALLSLQQMRVFESEETFWRHAVSEDVGSSVAWTEYGRLLTDQGKTTEARTALERAVALRPSSLLPWERLGNLALREGKADEAVRDFRFILERDPENLPGWKNLPAALMAAGQADEALATAREASVRFADDAEVASNLGVMLREHGDRAAALIAFQRARALAPRHARLALAEAMLYAELGRIADAQRAAAEAIALETDPAARAQLETWRAGLGQQ